MADRVIEEMRREEPDQPVRIEIPQDEPQARKANVVADALSRKSSSSSTLANVQVTSKGKKYRRRNRAVDVKTERFKL
ncbi:hypothetical protein M5689_022768 [Euphorbia peplus]|nr:hypothetical protein M5689_013059 [Euphorbia peplus]WCJ40703.1 hypothetical protein M5689_021612 [Euphorbia peplus]WCJ40795.1 hypothetical protein M5689_021701 [Euphorbia peplus]WCJ41933.1 hypothetical protein M5689_022768 [Euphorbia peplus]